MSHSADVNSAGPQDNRLLEASFILGTISFALGLLGYWSIANYEPAKIVDSFYSSAHLFALHMQESDIPVDAGLLVRALFYGARLGAVFAYVAAAGSLWVRLRKLGQRMRLSQAIKDENHVDGAREA